MTITIYTDGAAIPNPGRGAYAAVLIHGKHRKELSQGFELTTNNRMELLAAIVALETLRSPQHVQLKSDSRYVVDTVMDGSLQKWKLRNWKRKQRLVPNYDLWQRLLPQLDRHSVKFTWVPGHSGILENERCDELASIALNRHLLTDIGYVNRDHTNPPCKSEQLDLPGLFY